MVEKTTWKTNEGDPGNYALYIQGEKYPRAVFMNKTEKYAQDAAKIMAATPLLHVIPNPNAKEEVIRAEIENYFYVKNLVIKKIPTIEEAHRLKQGILNNALSKNKKQQAQVKQPQVQPQKLSTRDIVAQAIQRIQDMQREMHKPLQKVIQQQKPAQPKQSQNFQPPQQNKQVQQQKSAQIHNFQKIEPKHPILIKIQQKSQQQKQIQQKPVQHMQSKKPIQHQQKQYPKQPQEQMPRNAVPIQDEIRRMIREELSRMNKR